MNGAELVKWIRALPGKNRYIPILVLTGYSNMSNLVAVRDSGANLMIRKPASPKVLYDHIEWSAKTSRPFVESDNYVGPDRRFKSIVFPTVRAGGKPIFRVKSARRSNPTCLRRKSMPWSSQPRCSQYDPGPASQIGEISYT